VTTVVLGANYASGADETLYPSYTVAAARIYVGSDSAVPTNIMSHAPFARAYTAGKRTFVLSWKDNNETRVKAMLASIPDDCICYGTYFHEPEDNIPAAFTLATWRSRVQTQATWMAAEGVTPCVILMSYTLNPSSGRNIADYMGIPGVNVVGWDYYPDKQAGRYTPAQMVALLASAMNTHGVTRALIGEFGVAAGDSQRIARINQFRDAILADGRYEVSAYWSQNAYILAADTAAAYFATLSTGDPVLANSDPAILTDSSSSSSAASYNTASVTPTTGARLLLRVVAGGPNGAVPTAPTITGLGLTWTLVDSQATGNSNVRLAVYTAVATGSTGALTIAFGSNPSNCSWQLLEVSNASGTPAVAQHAATATLSTTPAATLTTPASNSTVLGFIAYNAGGGQAITVGTGWTQLGSRRTLSSPSSSAATEWDATSASGVVGWTTGDGSGKVVAAIELTSPDVPAEAYGSGLILITGHGDARPPTELAVTPAGRTIAIPPRGRTVPADHLTRKIRSLPADPREHLDYVFDLAGVMTSEETLVDADILIDGDATLDAGPTLDGTLVTCWLTRGPTDVDPTITCRAQTSVGRSFDRSLILRKHTATVLATGPQDPDETLDWLLDWTPSLTNGETLTDVAITSDPTVTVTGHAETATSVTVWTHTTAAGSVWLLVTTSLGRVERVRFKIPVRTL